MLAVILTILQTLFATLESHTLQSDLRLTLQQPRQQPVSYAGTVMLRGEQFKGELMNIEMAYDGKTLYNYSEETNELTLSYPSLSELYQTNPFLFAKALSDDCTITESNNPREHSTRITLVPNDPMTGIINIIINVSTVSPLPSPVSITVNEETDGGVQTTTLKFVHPTYSDAPLAPDAFTVTPPQGAFVNDIRL